MAFDRSLSHHSRVGNNLFYFLFFVTSLPELIHNVLMSGGSLLKQEALFMQKSAFFLTPRCFIFSFKGAKWVRRENLAQSCSAE